MSRERDDPPSNWSRFPVAKVTDDIYFGWPEGEEMPWFWHWCAQHARWSAAGTDSHTLVAREPIHLEPSLLWNCCGLHGFLRNGEWTSV